MKEKSILEEAQEAVYGDRQADYGSVRENFSNIAKLWSVILKKRVTPEQVGLCMVQVKVARQLHKPKRDNLVDGAGYFATISKMEEESKELENDFKEDPIVEEPLPKNENPGITWCCILNQEELEQFKIMLENMGGDIDVYNQLWFSSLREYIFDAATIYDKGLRGPEITYWNKVVASYENSKPTN